ncbi:MAG: 5-formyltetrahydrofolate cyclo-ligase [Leptolyngbyaceae cyanobacterium HOT.MB2.61]|nr:5-formyltetrahydrofolate cyclo-ligase [Leptolyngbyaceae cyanobacterium HOT.MB2.61]
MTESIEVGGLDKRSLRKSLLAARQAMPIEVWRERSNRLCTNLRQSSLFTQAHTILAYFSFRQEPDLSPLFVENKVWGFPRCAEKSLLWHTWAPHHPLPLQVGAYGIQEPHPNSPILSVEQVDLLLVPAVACDERGYRLGYGGGFYDRLLSQPEWAGKWAIGIVFDSARLTRLPDDPWDKPLSAVCTESGLFFSPAWSNLGNAPL